MGEVINEYVDFAVNEINLPVATSSRSGLHLQSDYFDGGHTGIDSSLTFRRVPEGYITYRHMSDDSIFHFNENRLGRTVLVSKEYPVFSCTTLIDQSFLLNVLNYSADFRAFAIRQKKGGTRTRLYFSVLQNFIVSLPTIAEQARIGEFFRVLDDLIAAAKKKADLLKLKKRYYLQAIFNQRLRFKGFTEPWQQRKLGELFKERSERSNQGELISVTITNGVVPASSLERKDNSSEDKSNYKQVKTGDIAYNTMRMWQGASGVSPYSGILSPAYTVLIPSSEVSSSFFAQMFKLVRMLHLFQRYSQGLTSDTWNLKYPLLSEIRVTIPSLAEQERISEFLVLNDELTALVKKKAEDLQKIKSYYLQQLFV